MEQFKFRGKSIKTGKWLYGYLAEVTDNCPFLSFSGKVIFKDLASFATDNFWLVTEDCKVDEKTISIYSGLKDKNGKEVYSGDMLHVVEYQNKGFSLFDYNELLTFSLDELKGDVIRDWTDVVVSEPSALLVEDTYLNALFGDMRLSNPIYEIEVVGSMYDSEDKYEAEI